jgi:hypothetical protein
VWSVPFGLGTPSAATNFEPDPDPVRRGQTVQANGSSSKFTRRHRRTFGFVRIVRRREASDGGTLPSDPMATPKRKVIEEQFRDSALGFPCHQAIEDRDFVFTRYSP